MLDKPISRLRRRMIEDMTARRFKEKVQKDYIRHVRRFAAFLGRSPDSATSEDVRRFQLHMAEQRIGVPTINSAIAAPRFFFNVTLERPDLVRHLTSVHKAVSRAEPGQPDVGPPTQPRRARGGAGGRDRQAGVAPYVAA
jgi:integrase/recombinase XerD